MTDQELIEQHRQGSADAFTALVRRHVDWVYSAASRRVGDAHLAEDMTQAVFTTLARKLPYSSNGSLSPWLFGVLIRTCKVAVKRQATRRRHETEAAKMRPQTLESPANAQWSDIAPHLEEMVNKLRTSDREIVLLRFYEQKSFAEIAEMIGITEDAARKRVSRSVEALRGMLSRKGVSMPAAALAGVLVAETVKPAPAALAVALGAAWSAGTVAGASTAPHFAKEALQALRWTQLKWVGIGIAVVLAIGGFVVVTISEEGSRAGIAATALAQRPAMPIRAATEPTQRPQPPLARTDEFGDSLARQEIQKGLDGRDAELQNFKYSATQTSENLVLSDGTRTENYTDTFEMRRLGTKWWAKSSFKRNGVEDYQGITSWDGHIGRTWRSDRGVEYSSGVVLSEPAGIFSEKMYGALLGVQPFNAKAGNLNQWLRSETARSQTIPIGTVMKGNERFLRIELPAPQSPFAKYTILLDATKGMMPVRCEERYEHGKSWTSVIWEALEIERVGNLWVATTMQGRMSNSAVPGIETHHLYKISDFSIGTVTDNDMDVSFPPNTRVMDEVLHAAYLVKSDHIQPLPYLDRASGKVIEPSTSLPGSTAPD